MVNWCHNSTIWRQNSITITTINRKYTWLPFLLLPPSGYSIWDTENYGDPKTWWNLSHWNTKLTTVFSLVNAYPHLYKKYSKNWAALKRTAFSTPYNYVVFQKILAVWGGGRLRKEIARRGMRLCVYVMGRTSVSKML